MKDDFCNLCLIGFQLQQITSNSRNQNQKALSSNINQIKMQQKVPTLLRFLCMGAISVKNVHQLNTNVSQNCGLWVNKSTVWICQNIKNVNLQLPPALLICILVLGLMHFSLCLFPENGNSNFFVSTTMNV